MALTDQLEELRVTLVERGCDVDQHLKPGLSSAELMEQVRPLGLDLPDGVVELYAWRGGQGDEAEMSVDAFRFRDNTFVDVARSLEEYAVIQQYWAPASANVAFGFDFGDVFPIAAFMGSRYAVVCGEHTLAGADAHPVVDISHGSIGLFFHSLTTMLATCIEWVQHPSWSNADGLPSDVELEVWLRHNPGVFER